MHGRPPISNIEAESQEKGGSRKCRYLGKEELFQAEDSECSDSGASVCVALQDARRS